MVPQLASAAVVRGEQATSQPARSHPTPLTVWFVGPPGAPPASRLAKLGALVGGGGRRGGSERGERGRALTPAIEWSAAAPADAGPAAAALAALAAAAFAAAALLFKFFAAAL